MPKIYTRTGDKGETSLSDGTRVSKRHPRITAFNNIDEANSMIGIVRSLGPGPRIEKILKQIQNDLFILGADLATPKEKETAKRPVPRIRPEHVQFLERTIDACEDKLPPLKHFILPAGSPVAAHLHMARALVRRAERKIIDVDQAEKLDPVILEYANRLSDGLFVLARLANFEGGVRETEWISEEQSR